MTDNHTKDDSRIDYKHNWKVYLSIIGKYKGYIFFILLCSFILEATRTVNDFLFKNVMDHGTEYYNASLTKDAFISTLVILAAIFAANILIRSFSRWMFIHLINKFEGNIILDLKQKFFNHLIGLSYNFHTSTRTGSLISKLIRGGGAIERMTDVFIFNVSPLIFQLVIVGASLLYFDPISSIVVITVVLSYIGYGILINKLQQKANIEMNDAEDHEKANISDIFTNVESIKYFGKEEEIKHKYAEISANSRTAMVRHWDYYRALDSGQILILGIGTFLIVYFPIMRFINNEISLGTVIFIYTTYGNLFGQLYGFVHGIKNYFRAMGEFESLFKYYKVENDIKDNPDSTDLEVTDGEIEFKNVTFKYKDRDILKNFSLKIPKKKKVAIVGSSGAGKSTIIRLIYRLYDVDSGEVLVDGKNVNTLKQRSLRRELSIVPQECILFDDTIYNNIAFSRPSATREEVLAAMRFAQLDKIVEKFPHQENTIVGERGVKLSGGEKQRVSIARALLADKKILILDEATSSLDSETESEIQKDMHKLMQGRTSIIIAHRLSTIMQADLIVVVENGKIIQKGNHQDLIKKKGTYKKLWELQKGGYLA